MTAAPCACRNSAFGACDHPSYSPGTRMAGTAAALMISMYGIPVISTMMKAPAPMIGGISTPPVEAQASVAAA